MTFSDAGLQIRVRNRKIIFSFLKRTICCGYSKEPSQRDGSFEHPNHMKNMDKEIFTILRRFFLSIVTSDTVMGKHGKGG